MPPGIQLRKAMEWAAQRDQEFRARDFSDWVIVRHDEGLYLRGNSLAEIHEEWLVVFSEHAEPQIFHQEDVDFWAQFEAKGFEK